MKKPTELSIGIIAIVSALILAGCSKSVDNGTTPTNAQKPEPTKAETPQADSTSAPTPIYTQSSSATTTPIATQTPAVSDSSMASISDAYMSEIRISEDCPEAIYEKKADVTYGTVVHKTYDSKTTGLTRGGNIVLPPN